MSPENKVFNTKLRSNQSNGTHTSEHVKNTGIPLVLNIALQEAEVAQ